MCASKSHRHVEATRVALVVLRGRGLAKRRHGGAAGRFRAGPIQPLTTKSQPRVAARPSTSGEDETVRENGSYDGGTGVGRPTFDSGSRPAFHVKPPGRRPSRAVAVCVGPSSVERSGSFTGRPDYPSRRPDEQQSARPSVRTPRAAADAGHPVQEPTSAMPVYEGSGGPNTIVSASGHRGRHPRWTASVGPGIERILRCQEARRAADPQPER
jgi:hypothetical protein